MEALALAAVYWRDAHFLLILESSFESLFESKNRRRDRAIALARDARQRMPLSLGRESNFRGRFYATMMRPFGT